MKIRVIVPIIDADPYTLELREKQLQEVAAPDTELEIVTLDKGPVSIELAYDDVFVAPDLLRKVKEAEDWGFDAVVIHCGMDPGLDAARELVRIPVVSIGQASMLLALAIGDCFSVICPGETERIFKVLARTLGIESQLASVRLLNMHVLDLVKDRDKAKQRFVEEARRAIEVDKADVIIPGCGFFTTMIQELQEEIGVPVISPGGAALTMAEALVRLNLAQSKKAYPQPQDKKRTL